MTLSKRERLEKTIAGEKVDRVPVALWRHFPGDDQRPADLVSACVDFQKTWDFDFIKITPASTYSVVDLGVQDEWLGNVEGTRDNRRPIVNRSLDWTTLRQLDPHKGALGQQVDVVRLMGEAIKGNVPFIQTVFNPLAQARHMTDDATLIHHMRTAPARLKEGLEVLTDNTIRFIDALRKYDMAGIFFAVQHASYAKMSRAEYEEFGRPYDLRILNALPKTWWLNMMHLHGAAPMLDVVGDYPVQAINWHDQETDPDLVAGQKLFSGAACGGVAQGEVYTATPLLIQQAARRAIDATRGNRLILSTGCVIMTNTPFANIRAVREIVEEVTV